MFKKMIRVAVSAAVLCASGTASAGPFILAGTDADDHGSSNGTANLDGWFFMQRALENIAPGVTNSNKVVVSLGSSSTALAAAQSAFNLSNLASQGWTFQSIDGDAAINNFFMTGGSGAGIIMLDSGGNVSGGLSNSEESVLQTNALAINSFLSNGGGLFSQANSYNWLSAIIPGITLVNESNTGINLTPAGSSAFPGLTADDLSSGPYHAAFMNYGAVPVLGVGQFTGSAVILGANSGSITDPGGAIPEPATAALLLGGLGLLGASRRKRSKTN